MTGQDDVDAVPATLPDDRDKPATALAHGPAKCSDIERVRRDVDEADASSVSAQEVAVARRRERVSDRERSA